MANWVENELKITGPRRDREAFLAAAAGQNAEGSEIPISFAALLPIPDGEADPSQWAWNNWGTRADIWEWMASEQMPRSFVAWFATAWAAPTTLLEIVSLRFPTLTFRLVYQDEAGGFSGGATIKNGESELFEKSDEEP